MTGFEYGNTRLRAMSRRILGRADLSELIAASTIERMLTILADTPYGPDVEEAMTRARGLACLDIAARSHLARTLHSMASFYGDKPRRRVDVLLQRWDLHNLRVLLHLPSVPAPPPHLAASLVPAGRLGGAELSELAAQDDVAARLDLLITWAIPSEEAATALLRARSQYRADESGPDLDRVITELFTGVMEDRVGDLEGPAEVLRAEMDARHVENALRRREARLAGESGWQAPPGSPARVWEEVVETDEAGAAAELVEGRRNLPGWRQALRDWVGHGRITTLSDDLRRVVTHAAVSRFVTGDPLGFDIPLAYTFAKEAETRDLHLIARGLVHGLPPAEVEERLETAA